jgi:pimeloyl-ACP methyl ester carboxylesterase
MTEHFTTSDGLRLAYTDQGHGSPVLCLAGLTRNLADFDDLLDARRGAARFICLTSRGRAGSDFDPDWKHYSITQESLDALALIDHLGLDKVTIVGTSRGGLVALALAAYALDRISGVLFNDVGPVIEKAGTEAIAGYLGFAPKYKSLDIAADSLLLRNAETFPGVSWNRWRACAGRWWRETRHGLEITYDPHLRDAFLAATSLPPIDIWPLFDALAETPMGLVRGVNSNVLGLATADEMQRRHQGLIRTELPDRGHVPFLDEPGSLQVFDALLAQVTA